MSASARPAAGRRLLAALLAVAAVAAWSPADLAARGLSAPAGSGLRPLARPGDRALGFALKDLSGRTVAFRPGGGRPALLVFWSAFCPLCRELVPVLDNLAQRHAGKISLYTVNLDGPRFSNAVASFVRETRLKGPVLLDDLRNDLFIASDPYGIQKTPTAVLVDGAGTVRGVFPADEARRLASGFERFVAELQAPPGGRQ